MPGMRYKPPINETNDKKDTTFSNGEKAGMALSLVLFLYGLSDWDLPLCFFTGSFLIYEAHVLLRKARGDQDWFMSNLLKGMSIAMFVGSIMMVLL
ncbi:hypothetical protein D081_2077 [Anaerovibrio sp. JC8]|uniref:hypothetical protein n=1 Tax=Anaerovibrio sp. JC8 TaxID=1240085 RepID=UPI000A0DA169|nr:hypothetical protein [Anaerovibrio sp. JC8]ORT99212.1 hypothetical protein D081_2077 [Anaerovibrio sp. JC8]